jgi:hypothetical protein
LNNKHRTKDYYGNGYGMTMDTLFWIFVSLFVFIMGVATIHVITDAV